MNFESPFPGLELILSEERFRTYLTWAGGDRERAIALYILNTQLSECLYVPLQMLEVALRNRIHQVLSATAGDAWFDFPEFQLNSYQAEMLANVRAELQAANKPESPGAIVAGMTFGYWSAMLGKEYENLWQKTLHNIAKREDGKGLRRKDFSSPLGPIRMLRNRVAHHEPILFWSLGKHYRNILQLTRWLSPVAADWTVAHCRFPEIYPEDGIEIES